MEWKYFCVCGGGTSARGEHGRRGGQELRMLMMQLKRKTQKKNVKIAERQNLVEVQIDE